MPAGLQVWDSAGVLSFDSNNSGVGCVADQVASITSSFNKSYPQFAGRTAIVLNLNGLSAAFPASISYSSGYPVITFPATITAGDEQWLILMA